MNFYKVLKFIIPAFVILSTIIMLKDQIKGFVANYLPFKLKSAIKVLIKDKSFALGLYNDYNQKFLPETQFNLLKFDTKKLNFLTDGEAGYFQKVVKKSNQGFKSFYLEKYNNNIFITNVAGETFVIDDNLDIDNFKKFKNINLKNVKKVLDTLVYNNDLYISYIEKNNDCSIFKISKSKISNNELIFSDFFKYNECGKWIQGGRMQPFILNEKNGLIFSLADNVADEPNQNPQSNNSLFGKIVFIDFKNKKEIIYSKGHRNPQGLLSLNGIVLSTEHGPRGGDEINKIEFAGNYGWPISSYGLKYNGENQYYQSHADFGFIEPIYSFVPSIGISEIIKLPNKIFDNWNNSYLISSLYRGSIFRTIFNKDFDKVIYFEEIFIGQRIRDIMFFDNKIILALESKGEIGILYE